MKTMMKLAAVVPALALAPVSANASDLFDGLKDPAPESYSNPFAGFYIGAQGGGQFVNLDIEDQFDGIGADGLIGGAHGGYNFCTGNFCTGPYIEGGWSNVDVNALGDDILYQEWYAQGGWILGYRAMHASLIYAKAAYEFSSWKYGTGPISDADVESYVIGGGIDTLVSDHVSLGIFADYLIPSNIDADGIDITDELEQSESLRAGVKLTVRQ